MGVMYTGLRGNSQKNGTAPAASTAKRAGIGSDAASEAIALFAHACARTADDHEGGGFHDASDPCAHHPDATLQSGLRLLQ